MAPSDMEEVPAAGASPLPAQQPAQQPADNDNDESANSCPVHPIPQLQAPFEESIRETNEGTEADWVVDINAQSRRRDLLENDDYERICGRKWRQRSTERYHPFWKLVSQMAFGVHLLAKKIAISEVQVMKILQTHVDELDGFLQRTTEDFLIIRLDVRTRSHYLKLPLGDLDVFDAMLEDRTFRLSLVAYNDQIEHAVTRFTLAITDALKDLRKGKEATGALWHYMNKLADEGCFESETLKAFYEAMKENLEGWILALSKLRRRGAALQKALGKLALSVTEMQRRVGMASRKDLVSGKNTNLRVLALPSDRIQRSLIKANSSTKSLSVKQRLFTKSQTRLTSNKPLPRDPLSKARASQKARTGDTSPPVNTSDGEPNAASTSQGNEAASKTINRAKSCSALMDNANAGASTPPPRTPGRLARNFSKPFLPKRNTGENTAAHHRPATAPARILKSRSASLEQLKALWSNSRPRTQQRTAKSPTQPRGSPVAEGPEKMKDQISHFLKTDRVVEAWETVANKTSNYRSNFAKSSRDWPCSMFRTKSSTPWRNHPANNGNGGLSGTDLEKQMSWVQDSPEGPNTYTFRHRSEVTPRIHVIPVQSTLDERTTSNAIREETRDVSSGDAGRVITALPSMSLPTASMPSVSLREIQRFTMNKKLMFISQLATGHRPRMVGVA